jgi:hypothetical protein
MPEFKHGPEFSTLTHRAVKAAQAVVNTQWTNKSALAADHPLRQHAQKSYAAVIDHINQHNPNMATDDIIHQSTAPTAELHAMEAIHKAGQA